MEFILTYKWLFLLSGEIIFTLCAVAFLVIRYWFQKRKLSIVVAIIFILNDLWIAFIAYVDYKSTGQFKLFQIVSLLLVIYAVTIGKADMKKLDARIKHLVALKRGKQEEI